MTTGSDQPLPDLYRATLSDELLEQLLADLAAQATIEAIQVRRRPGVAAADTAITLDGVWRSGEDYADRDIAWTRRFFAALDSYRDGV